MIWYHFASINTSIRTTAKHYQNFFPQVHSNKRVVEVECEMSLSLSSHKQKKGDNYRDGLREWQWLASLLIRTISTASLNFYSFYCEATLKFVRFRW